MSGGKPTYYPKMGSSQIGVRRTAQQSGKDQTAHTKLKYRQIGQNSLNEMRSKDFKVELRKKESDVLTHIDGGHKLIEEAPKPSGLLLLTDVPHPNPDIIKKYDDSDAVVENSDFDSRYFDVPRLISKSFIDASRLLVSIVKVRMMTKMTMNLNFKLN